jgi:aminopeptidase N
LTNFENMRSVLIFSSLLPFVCAFSARSWSQPPVEFSTDVLSYHLAIELSDSSDVIHVNQELKAVLTNHSKRLSFDLRSVDQNGKGMRIHSLQVDGQSISFKHENNLLLVSGLDRQQGDTLTIHLSFSGVPADGLIIGKNKFGNRTFFGDNWPNRAHHWFACNDHPSDKALISYEVRAPWKYQVIANGTLIEKRRLSSDENVWYYKADYELPTKVMVIGVAEFSEVTFGPVNSEGIPVSAWVYPQNEKEGFYDMELAVSILNWFENKISAYPFDKLANVQSTTRYGGMENASCIFYDENAITGKRTMESLIAHEIAHQWFGNSASEKDWPHLWLSEGFATYLTNVYIQETKGEKAFFEQLDKDAKRIFAFNRKFPLPVIDTISKDLNFLLNANAYQKGGWVLHMLRSEIGDRLFWTAVRSYYESYKFGNASSQDFQQIVEEVCACPMDYFFDQWLRQSGHPTLSFGVKKKRKSTSITLQQLQSAIFSAEVGIQVVKENGDLELFKIPLTKGVSGLEQEKKIVLKLPYAVKDVVLDPNRELLLEIH